MLHEQRQGLYEKMAAQQQHGAAMELFLDNQLHLVPRFKQFLLEANAWDDIRLWADIEMFLNVKSRTPQRDRRARAIYRLYQGGTNFISLRILGDSNKDAKGRTVNPRPPTPILEELQVRSGA